LSCRGCGGQAKISFIDLGSTPIANSLLDHKEQGSAEKYFPLHPMTCLACGFVQLSNSHSEDDIFTSDYVYFSSYSSSWLNHSRQYATEMIQKLGLGGEDLVIEVASNDGYLLQYFAEKNIRVLGIEPSSGVAEVSIKKGIETLVEFFDEETALKLKTGGYSPKLMTANNVLAHVPDINSFISGFSILLDENGVVTFEFPLLMNLIKNFQFDTIYHEHYSYLSLTSLIPIFENNGLKVFDVSHLDTHGGSVRLFVAKTNSNKKISESISKLLEEEKKFDPRDLELISFFQSSVSKIKRDLIKELDQQKSKSKSIAAYGAAAKGNTLLNYCGITSKEISYVVDLNPNKQGKFMPGSGIPIVDEQALIDSPPDVLLILPWNLSAEIKHQLKYLEISGTKFLRAIPKVEYF
jgi:hypothetical protein